MATQNIIDNSTQSIIKRYTILYKAIFQYSIYFVPLILWAVWAWSLQSSQIISRIQIPSTTKFPSYIQEDWIYKWTKVSDEVWQIFTWFGDVKILGWELQATGNVIIGRNNLITLWWTNWWIVLPNRPYIINMSFTWWLDYFTRKDYSIEKLKRVMDNWILSLAPIGTESNTSWYNINAMFFRSKEKKNPVPANMELLLKELESRSFFAQYEKGELAPAPWGGIKGQFIWEHSLKCLFGWRLIDVFCDINIDRMIKKIPEINLSNARIDLVEISRKIKRVDQVDAFCSNLMANTLKNPYPSAELDQIMRTTCKVYDERYEKMKSFLNLQNEIEWLLGTNVITSNIDFAMFKLVSIQQKIYAQHKEWQLDTNTVQTYLQYVSNLINEKELKIPQFYIESIYYFNNVYLQSMLKRLTIQSINPTTNDEVQKILDQIAAINKWNKTLNTIGLESLLINTELKKSINTSTWFFYSTIQNFEQAFTDMLRTFSEVRISKIETDETTRTARLIWVIRFKAEKDWSMIEPVPIIATFLYNQNWSFKVVSVRTPNHQITDSIVDSYINKNKNTTVSFGTIIYLIRTNIEFSNPDLWMCNVLLGINWISISDCTQNYAIVNIGNEVITLNISNNIVISWVASNVSRQKLVNDLINGNNINTDRISTVLTKISDSILLEDNIKKPEDSVVDVEKITIIEKFKQFIGIEPTSLEKKNGKRLASFSIEDRLFATVVDIQNNYRLSPLVVQVGKENIVISKFSISLINLQQKRITQFVEDPLEYIKTIDPVKYDQLYKLIYGE